MLNEFKNNIDYYIRNFTRFSRKNYVEKNKKVLLRNERENQYLYEIFKKTFTIKLSEKLSILDIGSKNWYYANSEHSFFSEFCKDFILDGIEVDAYRLYNNFYSRYEVAKFHTKNLKNTTYIADNLLNLTKKYDYIVWILPFVLLEPLQYWGLPKKFFEPEKLLKHAYNLLNTGGQMLIINQGEDEAAEQELLFQKLSIPYKNCGELKSDFFEYKHKRFGWLVVKTA